MLSLYTLKRLKRPARQATNYMFVRSETIETYRALFATLRKCASDFFDLDFHLKFGSLDHSDAIAGALETDWPGIRLLNCWPHFVRNANDTGRRLLLHKQAWENFVHPCLNWLHSARSSDQFKAMATVFKDHLETENETAYASWMDEEYLADRWCAWFATCSACPGILPNQNPIEAHHKKIKISKALSLRATTAYVLRQSLPRIHTSASAAWDGEPIRFFCSGVQPELVVRAQLLCDKKNHRFRLTTRSGRRRPIALLFNSRKYIVGNGNIHGVDVDTKRVQVYMQSLAGTLSDTAVVTDFSLDYLSLHRVEIMSAGAYEHDWESPNWSIAKIQVIRDKYRCDCKGHYTSGWSCSHILATLALRDGLDLGRLLKKLPARKPPGRPRKVRRALERDDEPYFSVQRLVKKLTERPGTAINWQCSKEFPETVDGQMQHSNYIGKVQSWANREGIYYWKVTFDNGVVEHLGAEDLARAINAAHIAGVAVAGQ